MKPVLSKMLLRKINIVFAAIITLLIDIIIVKEIGFAFVPMLLMSIIFFLISFLVGMIIILLIKGFMDKGK